MPQAVINGISMYYEEHGAGPPLLLIMGFGANATAWDAVLPALSARCRVIAFDNRGAGRSDAPDEPYTMAQLADDAWALLDALGIAQAHIFGISMGGMIAQHVYFSQPDRVRSLILGCTTPGGAEATAAEPAIIATLMGAMTLPPLEAFAATLPIMYSDEFAAANRELLLTRAERNAPLRAGEIGIKGQLAAIQGHDLAGRLREIAAPTLVLHGDADGLAPTANGQLIAERIAGARLVLYPGARHGFLVECASAVSNAVVEFLGGVSVSAAMA